MFSFNFIYYAGAAAQLYSSTWISADSISFHYALNGLPDGQRVTKNEANTIDLLEESIKFINEHGAQGTIFTLTSAEAFDNSPTRINKTANELLGKMAQNYPFVTVEIMEDVQAAFNQNGSYSFNNHFFFSKLSNQTQGVYIKSHLIDIETNWWWSYYAKILSLDYLLDQGFGYIQNYYDFVTYNYDFNDGLL